MIESRIEVDLDTQEAGRRLRKLRKRQNEVARGRLRRTARAVRGRAIGFAAGLGLTYGGRIASRFRGPSDPWAEMEMRLLTNNAELAANATIGNVKARQEARADTVARFSNEVGRTGNTDAARRHYAFTRQMKEDEHAGRLILRRDVVGPTALEFGAQVVEGFAVFLWEVRQRVNAKLWE